MPESLPSCCGFRAQYLKHALDDLRGFAKRMSRYRKLTDEQQEMLAGLKAEVAKERKAYREHLLDESLHPPVEAAEPKAKAPAPPRERHRPGRKNDPPTRSERAAMTTDLGALSRRLGGV